MKEYTFPPPSWYMAFVPAREWWQRWLWWVPVIQAELEVVTPRDASGIVVPWWFPKATLGFNNIRWMDPKRVFIANLNLDWLGLHFGIGVAVVKRRGLTKDEK